MAGEALDELRDLVLRHQVNILRYGTGLGQRMVRLLEKSEGELREVLRKQLARLAGRDPTSSYTVRRLKALIEQISEIRRAAYSGLEELATGELRDFVRDEAAFAASALEQASPVVLAVAAPAPELLAALVTTTPFEGAVMSEWSERLHRSELERIQSQIGMGMLNGETIDEIMARVLGTGSLRGTDGVLQISRNGAMSIARTAVNAYSNAARDAVFEENADIIQEEMYHATLDSRTTPICRALDGTRYPRGEGPHPPQHWQCRSIRVAIFNGEAIGNRPMKEITEQQIRREYEALEGRKPAFRTFARQRVRDMTSVGDANLRYEDWLRRQPDWFIRDVLGRDKARLFSEGGLTLDRFVDFKGHVYTLEELRQREAAAWRRVFGRR